MALSSIEEALKDYQAGRFVIVVDDYDRENEGDLTLAAQHMTPEKLNFMTKFGRGLICAALDQDIFDHFGIPMMVPYESNDSAYGTSFGVSVGARKGVTTGISAADRSRTIEVLTSPDSTREDLTMPGHIFPLRAKKNGVLERRGHTEAAVDLARLVGLRPAGVICEILKEDGSMARLTELEAFAKEHDLKIVSIEDLAHYRRQRESIVVRVDSAAMPTPHGEFQSVAFRDHQGFEHLAMCMGDLTRKDLPVRLHSACLTGDVFGSQRCDCGDQLSLAMERIAENGAGVVLYLAQEGRGIGLANKIKAYSLQDRGMDTVEANLHLGFPDDARTYDVGAAMLRNLGIDEVHLMTNNPNKVRELEACGIKVGKRLPHWVQSREANTTYLKTKAEKLGHLLEDPAEGSKKNT